MNRSLLAGLCFGLSIAMAVSAAENVPEYNTRLWQSDEGLPGDAVWTAAQTPDGFLWIGSRGGLSRFDGKRFAVFDQKNIPRMTNANVTGVRASRDGSLWMATTMHGIYRLENGRFTNYGAAEGLAGNDCVGSILEDADGDIWVGTLTGLSRFHDGKISTVCKNVVRGMCQDLAHNLWFATTNGVDCWSNGVIVLHFGKTNGLAEPDVRAICCRADGSIWVGTGAEVSRIDQGVIKPVVSHEGPNYNLVTVLYEDRSGTFWAGTYSGLNRIVDGKFVPELNADGLPYGAVMDMLEDREGNLWACAKDGLLRLKPNRVLCYTQRQGLGNDNVSSVLEDRTGTICIGTWGGGLNQLRDGVITTYTNRNAFPALALGIWENRAGQLWVGTDFNHGLFKLDGNRVQHFTEQNGSVVPAVRVISEDHARRLWLGTSAGLDEVRGGQIQKNPSDSALAHDTIRAIFEDHAGDLWIGTQAGLVRKHHDVCTRFTTTNGLPRDFVLEIFEDKENTLWLGTLGGGLIRFRNGAFTGYTTREGLFCDNISAIMADDNGWLWMGSDHGIFRVNRKSFDEFDHGTVPRLRSIAYGKTDGMINKVCNSVAKPSVWKARDGRLWFATIKGLCVIDPAKTRLPEAPPPPVVIEEVLTDENNIVDTSGAVSPISLRPGRGELEFRYAALAFRAPEENRYKYKLEGVDQDWVDADKAQIAHYNNIYPGKYHFRVIACNSDGVWNETGAAIAVVMQPHFWQTWWFEPALIIVAAGALLVGGRIFLERRREIERLRVRIAADLHDEIGGNLASIALLSQLGKKNRDEPSQFELSEINRIALLTVTGIRDIVWFINPDYDTMPEMVSRMRDVAGQLLIGIDYTFDSPDFAGGGKLPLEFRRNFFLIFKESLHNIVKHSKATTVEISLAEIRGLMVLRVADNGRGFDLSKVSRGNGLKNIRLRASQLGGKAEIACAGGVGAMVTVSVKVT